MLSGTINGTNIFISTLSGASVGNIAATITLDTNDKKTVTIDPSSDLTVGATFYVNVLTGCQDLATNALSPERRNHPFSTLYNFVEVYNVNSTTEDNDIGPTDGNDDAAGLKITGTCDLKDQVPKRVVMKLGRGSTPTTGTATLKIYNGEYSVSHLVPSMHQ